MNTPHAIDQSHGTISERNPHTSHVPRQTGRSLRYILAAIWFLFTVSLTIWWVIFGLDQIDNLMQIAHEDTDRLVRHQKMLLWEGGTLVISLALGACALAYYMVRERREAEQVQRFFATFTHELKTPLASVRLQAEALQDELANSTGTTRRLLERLVADTARLNLQLENSLFVADASSRVHASRSLQIEEISLQEMIHSLRTNWSTVSLECEGNALIMADRRAFGAVLQNLVQNARTHGRATTVKIIPRRHDTRQIAIRVWNDGAPFQGDVKRLGALFERFYRGSGSGIGLFLVRTLMRQMSGDAQVIPVTNGFEVQLLIPGVMQA